MNELLVGEPYIKIEEKDVGNNKDAVKILTTKLQEALDLDHIVGDVEFYYNESRNTFELMINIMRKETPLEKKERVDRYITGQKMMDEHDFDLYKKLHEKFKDRKD